MSNPQESVRPGGRGMTAIVLVIGAVFTLLTSTALVGLLREVTRFGCTYTEEGEGRGWFCGDGIGYILPGVTILTGLGALGLAAIGVIVAGSERRAVGLAVIAGLAPVIGLLTSVAALMRAGQAGYDLGPYAEAWLAAMPIAAGALVAAAATAFAAAGLAVGSPQRARTLIAISAAAVLVAAIAQNGVLPFAVAAWTYLGVALLSPPLRQLAAA